MDLGEEEPAKHEIGNRTYIVADVDPLDVDGVRTVKVGIGLFAVAFVALLPLHARLEEAGRGWWLWTALAGVGLGLLGLTYCVQHRRARRARTARRGGDPAPVVEPGSR